MLSRKIFSGGKLNRDDDNHLLPKNDWVDARNIRINSTADGSLGSVVNIKGTSEKYEIEFPNGTYRSVGARGFDNVGKIFIFLALVEGTDPDSKIVVWDYSTQTGTILADKDSFAGGVDGLDFSTSRRINHIDLVDEKYLYWAETGNVNPPRMLDITKNYGTLTERALSVIKQPPLIPISNVQAVDDPAGFYNSLGDDAWQFKYRYVYWDNSKSAYSPASSIGSQRSRGNAAIQTFASKVFDSAIQFNFNGGGSLVKGVEIIAREGVTSDWKLVTSFDFENQSYLPVYRLGMSDFSISYSVTFTVNGTPTTITGTGTSSSNALNDLNTKFNSSGLAVNVVKEFFDNANGYGYMQFTPVNDSVTLSVTTSTASVVHILQAQNLITNSNTSNLFTFTSSNNLSAVDQAEANAPFDYVPLFANSQCTPNGNYLAYGDYTEGYDNVDVDYSLITGLRFIEKTQYVVTMSNATVGSAVNVTFTFSGTFSANSVLLFQKNLGANRLLNFTSFPAFDNETENDFISRFAKLLENTEANGSTRVVFLDLGLKQVTLSTPAADGPIFYESVILSRNSQTWFKGGNKYSVGLVYIDDYGRFGAVNTVNGNTINVPFYSDNSVLIQSFQPKMLINSTAPEWASKYAIVVSKGKNIGKYLQFTIDDPITYNEDNTITILQRPVEDYNNEFASNLDMAFLPGDEVVLFNNDGDTFTTTLKEVNDDGNFVIYSQGLSPQLFDNFDIDKIELRKRSVTDETLFYQIAMIGDIDDDGYHLVPTGYSGVSQTAGNAASILLENGDASVRNVWMDSNPSLFRTSEWLEFYSFSDYDPALNQPNIGTPNQVNPFEKQTRYPSSVRFGGAFVVGTAINNINSFDVNSFKDFNLQFGPIQKLDIDGNRMLVGQRLRIGVAPVFESVLLDKQDTETVAISERLINDITYYSYEAGIGDSPESYVRWGSTKYFADKLRGIVCRIASNGITPISITAKMNSYFIQKLKNAIGIGEVVGGFDPKNQEYYLTILDGEGNETILFSENSNGFTSFIDMIPTNYVTLYQDIYSFAENKMWLHNSSETYNNFYGQQYDSEFTFVDNESPIQVKSYLSLSEISSDLWTAPEITTSLNQASNLIASDFLEAGGFFDEFEGGFFAGFLNDSNSPDGLIEGDTLKGKWIKIKLLNSNTNFVYLLGVGVNQVPSLQGNI